jgi:acetylornithine deacetylase/succinyl-diaminopimelate desuccinylase-like protein
VLLLAHLDVVEARREDWTVDPFVLTEKDGFFYGRGTLDVKGAAATLVASLLRLKQEGFKPDRDIILALTAGEETGVENGVQWLLANRRDLVDAEYCLNVDAGGGELVNGKRTSMDVQAAEKVYQSFRLTVRNAGGHSSLPTKDNAIYRLAAGLDRWSRYEFPVRLNDITRAYFTRMGTIVGGREGADMRAVARTPLDTAAARRLAASPLYNAFVRTTCVATQLEGGHAENALPQMARAVVNCRMLPDEDPREVRRTIARVVADTAIAVDTVAAAVPSPPSPLTPELLHAIEGVARSLWGPIPVVPEMETGATDGLFLRNAGVPVYGFNGIFYDVNDVRSHGRDERIGVREFYDGLEFQYRVIKAVSSPAA